MPMFKTCTACKETFIAESPFIKVCPICNAKSQTTPAERAQRKTRITPDRLMLDVRQADAAGKSYLASLSPFTGWRAFSFAIRQEERPILPA